MFGFRSKKYRKLQDIEPQEIFLDKLAERKEEEMGISEKKFEVPLSQRVLKSSLFFIFLVILGLFLMTFYFDVLGSEKYSELSNNNKFVVQSIRADRGVIYDVNGKQLVFNKPSFDLLLDKRQLPEDNEKILREVARIINYTYEELNSGIEGLEGVILIKENIDHETLISLESRINDFTGFYVGYSSVRYYEDGEDYAHVVGYTGRGDRQEIVGKDGIEKVYESELSKKSGEIKIERDVYGNILSRELVSLPEAGNSLVLWLDSGLQKKIYEVLNATLERTGAKKAVGIALNPKTGGVMGLVSLPSYDNNLFNKGANSEELKKLLENTQEPLFNRAISGTYPTGSTIKPIIATGALEEGIIDYKKNVNCTGQIAIPHKYDPEITYYHKDWSTHGLTDMRKAIAESCNVYFYTIGGGYKDQEGLEPSRIRKYLELFGWGSQLGIDLPGEEGGFIPYPEWKLSSKKEPWFDGDTYNLSIGQGDIGVTPLQVAAAYAAIANGGTLYSPKIVKEIIDANKKVIRTITPEILKDDFVDEDNLSIVREGMRWGVTGQNSPQASSILLNTLPISSAAKTGTAQTGVINVYHNWIGVFAPYEDPEIVLLIMIEGVKDLQAAALPSANQILYYYSTH